MYWLQYSDEFMDMHDSRVPLDDEWEYALEMLEQQVQGSCAYCEGGGCNYCLCVGY